VIGGTDVYQVFLDIGYDAFHLSWSPRVRIPDGTPVFPGIGPDRPPDDVLRDAGMKAGPMRLLDPAAGVTLVSWVKDRERRRISVPIESHARRRRACPAISIGKAPLFTSG